MRLPLLAIAILSFTGFSLYAEHEAEKKPAVPPTVPKPAAVAKPCNHAELMRAHVNILSDETALKEPLKLNGKELAFGISSEMGVSRLVSYASADGCDVVFVFRGTKTENDAALDANAIPDTSGKYHSGFLLTAQAYKADVQAELKRNKCTDTGGPRVTFTGHSLGGAVAYAVANVEMPNALPASTNVVIFGAPRVVMQDALAKGTHVDRFPVEHYFIDKDPVACVPPAPPYGDLTTTNYRFKSVPISKEESVTGNEVIQNHAPANYLEKMDRLCSGAEGTTGVRKVTHNSLDALSMTAIKLSLELQKAVVKENLRAADAAFSLLPDKTKDGAKLPTATETADILLTTARTNPGLGRASAWNEGDGGAFGRTEACAQWGLNLLSETARGQDVFCNSLRTGFNEKAERFCAGKCGNGDYAIGACYKGCADAIHNFCVGKWKCKS